MRLEPIKYLISCGGRTRPVAGYAIQLPEPWSDIRLCVRELHPGESGWWSGGWRVEHYATGCSLGALVRSADTRGEALAALRAALLNATDWQLRILRAGSLAAALAEARKP